MPRSPTARMKRHAVSCEDQPDARAGLQAETFTTPVKALCNAICFSSLEGRVTPEAGVDTVAWARTSGLLAYPAESGRMICTWREPVCETESSGVAKALQQDILTLRQEMEELKARQLRSSLHLTCRTLLELFLLKETTTIASFYDLKSFAAQLQQTQESLSPLLDTARNESASTSTSSKKKYSPKKARTKPTSSFDPLDLATYTCPTKLTFEGPPDCSKPYRLGVLMREYMDQDMTRADVATLLESMQALRAQGNLSAHSVTAIDLYVSTQFACFHRESPVSTSRASLLQRAAVSLFGEPFSATSLLAEELRHTILVSPRTDQHSDLAQVRAAIDRYPARM